MLESVCVTDRAVLFDQLACAFPWVIEVENQLPELFSVRCERSVSTLRAIRPICILQ